MSARRSLRRRRVLSVAMAGMVLVLVQRAADLARSAMAKDTPAAASAPPAVSPPTAAKPTGSVAPVVPPHPAAPSPTPATDFGLLTELQHRREALDKREAKLNAESAMVDAAEARLRERLGELDSLQSKLEALRQQQKQEDQDRWGNLVKVYAEMKPRDAAAIFDLLDPQTLTDVLARMDDRKASGILAAMTPDRARFATQLLARRRADGPVSDQPITAAVVHGPG